MNLLTIRFLLRLKLAGLIILGEGKPLCLTKFPFEPDDSLTINHLLCSKVMLAPRMEKEAGIGNAIQKLRISWVRKMNESLDRKSETAIQQIFTKKFVV